MEEDQMQEEAWFSEASPSVIVSRKRGRPADEHVASQTKRLSSQSTKKQRKCMPDHGAAVEPSSTTATSASAELSFLGLPAELQLLILQLVPPLELLCVVPLVSRRWNELAHDEGLWCTIKHSYFGSSRIPNQLGKPGTHKDECVSLLQELKTLQQRHHGRLYEEERSYRQQQLLWACNGGHTSFVRDLFLYHQNIININALLAPSQQTDRTPLMAAVGTSLHTPHAH